MNNEAAGQVRQAIIIGAGQVGGEVLAGLEQRLIERHSGIPIVKLLALNVGPGPEDRYDGKGEIQRLDLAFDLGQLLEKRKTAIIRWLPDEAETLKERQEILPQTRLWGRLALFRHADLVHVTVREAANRVLSVATKSELTSRGLQVKDESSLDIYIVADLAEPFASGIFLDLAYLVAHTAEGEVAYRVFPQTTGLLFLPSFRFHGEEGSPSKAELRAQREAEVIREADAYAALKELDYYMDRRRYTAAYSAGLTFRRESQPFTRSCYLVDSINERNKGVPDQAQITEMTAEWLYQMLASPLKDCFQETGVRFADVRSHGKVAAYSSFGLAAYFLPVDEIIELHANRLACEMIDGYFLGPAPAGDELPPSGFGIQQQEVEDSVQADHAWPTKKEAYINVRDEAFENIAPYDLSTLAGQVRRSFGYRVQYMLPRLRQSMGLNQDDMLEEFQKRLSSTVAEIINTVPIGGIALARRFLHRSHQELQVAEKRARQEVDAWRKERKELETKIEGDWANHIASVMTFGTPGALAALVIVLLLILVWMYYVSLLLLDKLDLIPMLDFGQAPRIAAVVVLVGTLAAVGVALYIEIDWWRRSRRDFISDHRRQLRKALDVELKGAETHYYQQARSVVERQIGEVIDFQTRLEDLRDAFVKRMETQRPLYGSPRFVLEESVVDSDDVDRFYRELAGETLEDEIRDLFGTGESLYSWRDRPTSEIISELELFGRRKFDILRRNKSAEALLIRHAAEGAPSEAGRLSDTEVMVKLRLPEHKRTLRQRLEQLRDNSMPFLRYSDLELETGVNPSLTHRIGFDGARNENSLIYQVCEEQGIPTHLTSNRHQAVSMSARHGLPLAAVGLLRRWRNQYEALRSRAMRQLHTKRSHLALPDIFPVGEDVLQPQMAAALAIAYRKLQSRKQDGHYTMRYQDIDGVTVTADLGETKIDACVYLQDNPVVLRTLSRRIEEETVRRSEQVGKDGQKRGNQGVIEFLRRYRRRKRREEESSLEDWEEVMIDEYIAWLGR